MQKIRLLAHTAVTSRVLALLQRAGVVEFTEVTREDLERPEPAAFAFHYESARLDFAVAFLTPYAPAQSGLRAALEGTQERVSEERIAAVVKAFHADDVVDAAQDVQKGLNDATKKLRELKKEAALLTPWRNVPLIVGKNYDTPHTQTRFVVAQRTVATKADKKRRPHAALAQALEARKALYHIVSVDRRHAIVTWETSTTAAVREALSALGYDTVALPQRRGTAAEELVRITRAIAKTQKTIAQLEERARELARHLPELKILSDHMLWRKERHDRGVVAPRTEHVAVYEGWCPASHLAALEKALARETDLAALERIAPAKDEVPPVEIRNGGVVKPFEVVTRLYGLPSPRDIDPTPYLAGFFFLFFGFCLTDVGYGIILAAVTGFLLWRYDVLPATKTMLQLLFLGGIGSIVAGLFFGGYFGIDMALMPPLLQKIQLFDPIANPMPVFYLALALGVLQVITGLVAAIVRGVRYGEGRDALLDNGPWLAFFGALIFWGATKASIVQSALALPLLYAALASIVLTQGRKEKNIAMKLFKGVTSLYDSVSYFADILSYSRLLALGLATSALAFAVNLIAGMVAGQGEERTLLGLFFAGVVLVIGHLFNLAINAFGAFIHSARLQFVEFFGKFITGSGRTFAPFRRSERYVLFRD